MTSFHISQGDILARGQHPRHLGFYVRAGVALGLLAFLISRMQWASTVELHEGQPTTIPGVAALLTQMDLRWLVPVLLLGGLMEGIRALRWRVLMSPCPNSSYLVFLRWTLMASALRLVLPGVVGEDVYRVAAAGNHTSRFAAATAAVAWERTLGLLALALLAGCGAVCGTEVPGSWLLPVAAGGLSAVMVVALAMRALVKVGERCAAKDHGSVMAAARQMRRFAGLIPSPGQLAGSIALSFLLHVTALATFAVACRVFGIAPPIAGCALWLPAVWLAASLPVSLGGFGVFEASAAIMLTRLDAAVWNQAVAAVAGVRVVGVAVALLGWVFAVAIGARAPQRSLAASSRALPMPQRAEPSRMLLAQRGSEQP